MMAVDLRISYLEIEIDSQVAVELVESNKTTNVFLRSIVGVVTRMILVS